MFGEGGGGGGVCTLIPFVLIKLLPLLRTPSDIHNAQEFSLMFATSEVQ